MECAYEEAVSSLKHQSDTQTKPRTQPLIENCTLSFLCYYHRHPFRKPAQTL